ncbi:tetraacyldisaccharide 4'-kinase [Hyphomonas neptunium ATCC 15444]|uniref:Tetraacyldisaccharide 4'-kinase n=2 Tax=Hyphomonas TaxID=85 RepID=LPXK_HYPNA|nr:MULTISPECIES: tetraacyldisaccharide 4'-kinase [Hyphomonas]Q0C4B4.1 RecName: Full=Tetraacyldisaccharide 4'-kinase; AltName: Full=Lipid A 4'-kinase [Hyphomonas neptunium ATCC 15444]ABI77857.1 tetraacyldisaccharide 4'-kinase [Hyphomonas neptunium ATCC 15444]KCZ96358.1 tetraacyldisaccharide 4'-kinase [Hyphomonas hirschiana VP5]
MKAPYFWSADLDPKSREAAPLTRLLLTPFAMLYLWALRRKLAKARPEAAPVPVVCIGNLTAGGAGKTPVTEAIRNRIRSAGLRAASLSRGHGGAEPGPLKVDPARHTSRDVGDEPLLLAGSGEAWIGRKRPEAARAMAADGAEIILMDDGHQNPSLKKDLTLIVIDAGAPFGNGHVLPKGPLREKVPEGLARADAVILMGAGPVPPEVTASSLPVLRARLAPLAAPPPGPLVAFAGIGRPQKFFDSLAQAGGNVSDAVPFGDHHPYTKGDVQFLRSLAHDHGARLITTTKDHVRLPLDAQSEILAWPVTAVFEDTAALDAVLAPIFKRAGKP